MWNNDPDAAIPDIFGLSKMPSLTRTDHASNMNDSYWLAHPAQPLYGFDSSLGSIDSTRTPRTRSGLVQIAERLAGTDGLPGRKFTRERLQDLAFSNVAYMGHILRDDLVVLCQKNPVVTVAGAAVDISPACTVLAAWGGTSWVQVTKFTAKGAKARGVLAYSQSTNPASPHYSDLTQAYADKRWIELPFRQADVAAEAISTLQLTEGAAQCEAAGWKHFGNPAFADQAQCHAHFQALREARVKEISARRNR